MREITLKVINKPSTNNPDHDIEWFCHSLGLCAGRDVDKISTQIITQTLAKAHNTTISSQLLADELGLSVGRVNHHLRNLIDSGLLQREKCRIVLRGGSLKAAVREIRKDSERILDEVELMAEEIDLKLGLKSR